jgi:hypothetical protein
VLIAALEGLLSGLGETSVSLVNALVLAEERGIRLTRRTGAPEPGFETSIGVAVEASQGQARVAGALVGNSHGRVIRIDDYHVDVVPEGWILVITNRDVPGVIGRVGTLLGEGASTSQAGTRRAAVPPAGKRSRRSPSIKRRRTGAGETRAAAGRVAGPAGALRRLAVGGVEAGPG